VISRFQPISLVLRYNKLGLKLIWRNNYLLSTTVIRFFIILVASFIGGLLFFYVTSTESRNEKKNRVDNFISFLFNLIIFIWLGKIIVHFQTFISDPLAVLAYPSNSKAFYVAIILFCINIIYRKIYKKENLFVLLHTFVPIFIAGSFTYEFLQIIVLGSKTAWMQLTLYVILLILYVLFQHKKISIIVFIWIIGHLTIASLFSYSTIFGYILSPIFFIVLFLFALFIYMYSKRFFSSDGGWK